MANNTLDCITNLSGCMSAMLDNIRTSSTAPGADNKAGVVTDWKNLLYMSIPVVLGYIGYFIRIYCLRRKRHAKKSALEADVEMPIRTKIFED